MMKRLQVSKGSKADEKNILNFVDVPTARFCTFYLVVYRHASKDYLATMYGVFTRLAVMGLSCEVASRHYHSIPKQLKQHLLFTCLAFSIIRLGLAFYLGAWLVFTQTVTVQVCNHNSFTYLTAFGLKIVRLGAVSHKAQNQ